MKKLILGVAIFLTAIIYFINKKQKHYDNNIIKRNGAYYCNNHIIVNKDYEISPFYTPFPKLEALNALKVMISDADKQGFQLIIISGFRSYLKQMRLFKMYVQRDGLKKAQLYSAKPGFSEHQTGLAFDVATPGLHESAKALFQYTEESKWLEDNAHNYGFIIRYPEGKAHITQFMYEPWHLRYLGKKDAKEIKNTDLTLEEYFDLV